MESHHANDEILGFNPSMKASNESDALEKDKISFFECKSEGENPEKIGELAVAHTNDIFVYRQDVVKCSKREGLLGIVVEVAGDSDSEGSITDDGSEIDEDKVDPDHVGSNGDNNSSNNYGDDNINTLPDGQVRITWSDGVETIENTNDITVVDRSFLHGDIVASAIDPTGKLGLVIDVNIIVDLLSMNGEVINSVCSRDLKRIREFSVGDFVVFGPWLGRVDEVLDNVTVLFDDGSVCKVVKADPLRLKPVLKPIVDDADCPYYPGQRVRAVSSSVFKSSRWLSGLWKANRLEGTVIKVQTASVVVYWIASAYLGIGTNSASLPAEEQNPKNLTLLSCFTHTNWQLADWCLLSSCQQLSSVADSIPTEKLKEPIGDYNRHIKNNQINSCIYGGASTAAIELEVTDVDDQQSTPGQLVVTDVDNRQSTPGQVTKGSSECTSTSKEFCSHTQSDDYTSNARTSMGDSNGTESTDTPANCLCSSSSVPKEASHESWPTYRKKLRKVFFKREKKVRKKEENFERALFIVNTITKVDVVWQDGIKEYGLKSTSLIPIHTPNDNEFFPEQYVIEKGSNEEDGACESNRIGVVKTVNSQERTVCVRWLKPVCRLEDLKEFDCEEVVSAYELDPHPDYDYCYGDVVVRLPTPTISNDLIKSEFSTEAQVSLPKTEVLADESRKEDLTDEENQAQNKEFCEIFTSLSWVGNIIGLQDGDIEVTWADGMISKVGPQEIYVVGRDDDEVSDDGASWETVDENEVDVLDSNEKETDSQNPSKSPVQKEKSTATSQEDNTGGRSGPLAVSLAAFDYVTKFATGLLFQAKKQLDVSGSDQIKESEVDYKANNATSEMTLDEEDESKGFDVSDGLVAQTLHLCTEGEYDHEAATKETEMKVDDNFNQSSSTQNIIRGTNSMDDAYTFKHFDVAENPQDHHYLGDAECNGGRKWVKKVQQEWSILEKNLPDAIYVRVFEDHMDLIRAVIVGASGTPYHDGLFFFDFYLPPDYPQVPPSVYYHSGGLRINPNLYVDGKVCLSLLNTWTGRGNEVWDPSSSSILQVLVSLQGLVLNDKPYFNEAGYDKQIGTVEGEKNAIPYNENTYLLNLKTMLYLLRRPPMHFEDFVKDHFCRRGHYIIKTCETYMEGCVVGSLTSDACLTEKSREHACSVGFKLTLAKILPRLISSFREVGADCHQFEHLLKSENLSEG
ncbi:probable ubiquitin-conjugating enzyme E2 23 isoform X2 [Zingiber officinale]|uniref:probable ubiquitin-conjugating enzyme E2 23 isoform X2 n=1 Tax=Zingiber officinale TaxID=94328 RepID=UPI001C4C24BB|nr:probable ubiquitin-conjugating enzyme E2 23 isoform X2 [Zingiber officinale]